jgi:hypothetical protein
MKPPRPPTEGIDCVLRLLQTDLKALRTGERLDLEADVGRLLHDPAVGTRTPPDGIALALAAERAKRKGQFAPPPRVALDLEGLQAKLKPGADILLGKEGMRWVVPFAHDKAPVWAFEVTDDGVIVRRYTARTATDAALAVAADLLASWWPTLRRCKYDKCGVLFRPVDPRHTYHVPHCGDQTRMERFRAAHPRDNKAELIQANANAPIKKRRKTGKKRVKK